MSNRRYAAGMERGRDVSSWSLRPVPNVTGTNGHAMTIDVEDYFQVEAFAGVVDRESWDRRECRVEQNVDSALQMFSDAGVSATFFTLGWVAERYPLLIRRIVAAGHEIASHGLLHHRVDSQTHAEFLSDIKRAKTILEDRAGVLVKGYRAASFSIGLRNLWAYDALISAGYQYSSSVYPIKHDLYGIPEAPPFAFYPVAGNGFIEIPITAVRRLGLKWPCGGGGFFRLFPYWLSVRNMRAATEQQHQPCVFYFHPWELDSNQPRIGAASIKSRVRHYLNIGKMPARLRKLLGEFKWNRIDRIYPLAET